VDSPNSRNLLKLTHDVNSFIVFSCFVFVVYVFHRSFGVGIPLPVVIVWVVVKANWFTYTFIADHHVSPSLLDFILISSFCTFPVHIATAQLANFRQVADYRLRLIARYAALTHSKQSKQFF
jgi:hypothetical protein